MARKVILPSLNLSNDIQGRVTIELFDALSGGGITCSQRTAPEGARKQNMACDYQITWVRSFVHIGINFFADRFRQTHIHHETLRKEILE